MAQLTLDFHRSLAGSIALFKGRVPPETAYDVSFEGFLRSFGAMVLVVPPLILAIMAQLRVYDALGDVPIDHQSYWLLRLIMLPVEWIISAILLALTTRALQCDRAYAPFMIAHNWASPLLVLPYATVGLMVVLNVLNPVATPLLFLIITAFEFWMRLRITRIMLDVSLGKAIGVMAIWYAFSLSLIYTADQIFL